MGGRGTDQALRTADVVLMADRLLDVPYVIELARRMRHVVREHLVFASGVILTLAILTLNGLRLLRRYVRRALKAAYATGRLP